MAADEPVGDDPVDAVSEGESPEGPGEHDPTPEAPQLEVVQPVAEESDDAPHDETDQVTEESPPEASDETAEAQPESTADISDKVDRLLEELREVT